MSTNEYMKKWYKNKRKDLSWRSKYNTRIRAWRLSRLDKERARERSRDRRAYYRSRYPDSLDRRHSTREEFVLVLGGECIACGYRGVSIDFHHVGHKRFPMTVTQMNRPINDIAEEAARCVLLCRNCHFEEHERTRKVCTRPHSRRKVNLRTQPGGRSVDDQANETA